MSYLIRYLSVLLWCQYTYQDIFYVSNKFGRNHPENCIFRDGPCKTANYVIDHYKSQDNVLSIEFLNEGNVLKDKDVNCGDASFPFRHIELYAKDKFSSELSFDNVYFRDCHIWVSNIKFRSKTPYFQRATFLNSFVNFSRVNFTDIHQQIQLLQSNLTMTNISYSFSHQNSEIEKISNVPLINVISNHKLYPHNYVILNNWKLNYVQYPLISAHESAVKIENIYVSNHNRRKNGSALFVQKKILSLASFYNCPNVSLNNITIWRSNFLKTIIYCEHSESMTALFNRITVMNNKIDKLDNETVSILEINGKVMFDLSDITVEETLVNHLLHAGKETNATSIQNINFNGKNPISCDSGFYVAYSSCLPCYPGYYLPNNMISTNSCLICPPGTFSKLAGQSMCDDCEPGTYCKNGGCKECTACNVKFISSNRRATGCYVLPVFFYVASSVGLSFIILPSVAIIFKQMRKRQKKKKL